MSSISHFDFLLIVEKKDFYLKPVSVLCIDVAWYYCFWNYFRACI